MEDRHRSRARSNLFNTRQRLPREVEEWYGLRRKFKAHGLAYKVCSAATVVFVEAVPIGAGGSSYPPESWNSADEAHGVAQKQTPWALNV